MGFATRGGSGRGCPPPGNSLLGRPRVKKLEIPVLPEPLRQGSRVAVDDIAFLVLETPGDDHQDVSFPDPDLLLDLALDPPGARHPVEAAEPDLVCPEHQFGVPEHLPVSLVRQAHADNLIPRLSSSGSGFALRKICQFINPIFLSVRSLCVQFIQLLGYQIFSRKRNGRRTRSGWLRWGPGGSTGDCRREGYVYLP